MEQPHATPPARLTGLRLTRVPAFAGGLGAILKTFGRTLPTMGPVRTAQVLTRLNQPGGVDCPSCAWPEPDRDRPHVEFCENGAKAVASEATLARITRAFFAEHALAAIADRSDHWMEQQGRLTEPMLYDGRDGHYHPVSWDEAFRLIAAELNGLASPDEAIFYTSGRTSNEAAFLYQLFVRAYGTNNLPDCSNMCHESSGSALMATIGIGKGTVTLDDFAHADAIFILGQNPGTNHPRMFNVLGDAARRGCRIVAVNPLKEASLQAFNNPHEVTRILGAGTPIASQFVQVRINGDLAFMKALMKAMLAAERQAPGTVFDHAFIQAHTDGYDALVADLDAADMDALLAAAGVVRADLDQALDTVLGAKAIIACWAMGLTQHKNAVATIREVTNFLLLRGNVGRPGAGACPVRGHSNVQGDRTMGIYEKPAEAFLAALDAEFGIQAPREHGFDTVAAIEAMHAGRAHVFFAMGGNFLQAAPDTAFTAEALRKCRLTVHVATKLNRSHVVTGAKALILPCLGRTERDPAANGFVTTENSMGVVQRSEGRLAPASDQLLSEPAIVARLAAATLPDSRIPWGELAADYDRIRERIAKVVPGFDGYNAKVRVDGGFYLPNGPRDGRVFKTATGKARFSVNPLEPVKLEPGQLLLMTIRSHDQFNTTVYGLDDRYRGVFHERRVVFMHEADIAERGLKARQVVDLTSWFEGVARHAPRFMVVPYDLPRGCAAAYFPEANPLVPVGSFADESGTPTSKSVAITVAPNPDC